MQTLRQKETFPRPELIYFLVLLLLLSGCHTKSSRNNYFDLSDKGAEKWILDSKPLPANDSLFYQDDPAPLFRKEFRIGNNLKSAKLLITAAGYYKASVNGERVGDNFLDPAWTDFSKRIYYSEYDISEMVETGKNSIGVTLGNGFYNPLPLRMWGSRNMRDVLNTGRPAFIAKIILEYQNGKFDEVVTNEEWRYNYGALLKNNVYLGEVYDARKEIPGWDKPGFDDSLWASSIISSGPGGNLQKAFFPGIKIREIIHPVKIYSPRTGIYIADMGVNFTGIYRIKLKGEPGDSVVFRFGERVYPDGELNPMTAVCGQIKRRGMGGPFAPDTAWQTDTYVFGDINETGYQPEFTFHTFRYMEISGLKQKPELHDIEGLFLSTNVTSNNEFSSSNPLLNAIQDATQRTFLANLIGVQSDCAAREKFGYGGDLNAVSEAYIYNYDMKTFYQKTIYDWLDAMNNTGFVDTAPFVGIEYCGLSWESAFLITQYYLYLYYNDFDFVKEMYAINNNWMDKAARLHPDGWVDFGLGDHESLVPVPSELTGTAHYLFCAEIMQKFASLLGDTSKEKQYAHLAGKIKNRLKAEFWDKPYTKEINRQTLFSTLLYYNVIPEEEIPAAVDSLLTAIQKVPSGHFTTGIFGTKHILEALSKYVSPAKVYEIVNSREFPGWGFMIDRGATTIWETWKESENTYSNCHPMFGSVTEWFYRWLGGIRPDIENPGFEKFVLAPFVPENLEYIKTSYESPFGKIVSNWKKNGEQVIYKFEIPPGSAAEIMLEKEPAQQIRVSCVSEPSFNPEKIEGLQSGKFSLSAGKYEIAVR